MSLFVLTWIVAIISLLLCFFNVSLRKNHLLVSLNTGLQKNCKFSAAWVVLCSAPFVALSALRYGGVDYFSSRVAFENIRNMGVDTAFSKLLAFAYRGIDSFPLLVAIYAILTIVITVAMINEQSNMKWLSILLFVIMNYFFESMCIFRQCLAVAICLYSVKYIINKRIIPFLILVFIAGSIHRVAFVFILAYLVNFITIGTSAMIVTCIVLFFSKGFFLQIVMNVANRIGYFQYYSTQFFMIGEDYLIFALYNFALLIFYILINRFEIKPQYNEKAIEFMKARAYIFIQFLSTCIICIGRLIPNPHRVMYFFYWNSIIAIPFFISAIKSKKNRFVVTAGMILVFTILYFIININNGYISSIKYQSILSH